MTLVRGRRQYRMTPIRDYVSMGRSRVDIAISEDALYGPGEAFVGSRPQAHHTDGVIPNGAVFQAERGISKSTDLGCSFVTHTIRWRDVERFNASTKAVLCLHHDQPTEVRRLVHGR